MRLRPGDTFDRYVIEALLGEGGMGEVYQARDVRLQRRVALKVLRKDAATDPEGWQRALVRMLREARAAAALNHPNTVAIYDIGEAEGQPYLAMELIEGLSLRRLLGGGASVSTRLGWLLDVARALSAAHRAGLVHRDVKPENVMLREDGAIKVLDFGIARRVHLDVDEAASTQGSALAAKIGSMRGADTVTSEGVMVGTPAYMAPEQLTGDSVDARTDQFGWGVLAYELITGRVPFGANLEGIKLLSAILNDEPPSLDGLVPPAVERVLRRTVAKRRVDRFSSMDIVVDALAPYVLGENAGGLHDVLVPAQDSTQPETLAPEDLPPNARALPIRPSAFPKVSIETKTQSSMPPPRAPTPTHTMRSPDIDKGARTTPVPPAPVVRIEMAGNAAKVTSAATTLESATLVPAAQAKTALSWRRWSVVGLGAIWIVAAVVWGILWFRKKPPPALPVAATPAPAPTPITELSLPGPSNPEALAAYKEALQGFRDASWELARAALERAVKHDPSLGAAFLRLALIDRFFKDTTSARASFQRAMQLRGTLSPRDQEMLDAFEPMVQQDPPDFLEGRRRVEAASLRYPGDAELVYLQVALDPGAAPEKLIALAERCLELDSKYADCWQVRFSNLFRLGREQEALDALDRCVGSAPSALDCLRERISTNKYMGRCDRVEADVRRWITKDQSSALAYRELAVALEARGEPRVAVGVAVDQAARRFKDEGRIEEADALRIQWALLGGDFDAAEKLARALDLAIDGDSLEEKHVVPARVLVQMYGETGQERQAAEVADRFLTHRAAWTKPLHRSPWRDPTATFLQAKRAGGLLEDAAHDAARDDWARLWSDRTSDVDRVALWLNGYVAPARTERDARRALALMPAMQPATYYTVHLAWVIEDTVGAGFFLAGEYDKAVPYLERASRACTALDDPIRYITTLHRLGVVRQAQNDNPGACAAFQSVLARWGDAKRSVTARDAAARARTLKCQD